MCSARGLLNAELVPFRRNTTAEEPIVEAGATNRLDRHEVDLSRFRDTCDSETRLSTCLENQVCDRVSPCHSRKVNRGPLEAVQCWRKIELCLQLSLPIQEGPNIRSGFLVRVDSRTITHHDCLAGRNHGHR